MSDFDFSQYDDEDDGDQDRPQLPDEFIEFMQHVVGKAMHAQHEREHGNLMSLDGYEVSEDDRLKFVGFSDDDLTQHIIEAMIEVSLREGVPTFTVALQNAVACMSGARIKPCPLPPSSGQIGFLGQTLGIVLETFGMSFPQAVASEGLMLLPQTDKDTGEIKMMICATLGPESSKLLWRHARVAEVEHELMNQAEGGIVKQSNINITNKDDDRHFDTADDLTKALDEQCRVDPHDDDEN